MRGWEGEDEALIRPGAAVSVSAHEEPGAEPAEGVGARPAGASAAQTAAHRGPLPHRQFQTTHGPNNLPNNLVMLNTACPEKSPETRNQVQNHTQPPSNFVTS